jgi:hypothetical protein
MRGVAGRGSGTIGAPVPLAIARPVGEPVFDPHARSNSPNVVRGWIAWPPTPRQVIRDMSRHAWSSELLGCIESKLLLPGCVRPARVELATS